MAQSFISFYSLLCDFYKQISQTFNITMIGLSLDLLDLCLKTGQKLCSFLSCNIFLKADYKSISLICIFPVTSSITTSPTCTTSSMLSIHSPPSVNNTNTISSILLYSILSRVLSAAPLSPLSLLRWKHFLFRAFKYGSFSGLSF